MNPTIVYVTWNPNTDETSIRFNKTEIIFSNELIVDGKLTEIHSTSGLRIKFHPKG